MDKGTTEKYELHQTPACQVQAGNAAEVGGEEEDQAFSSLLLQLHQPSNQHHAWEWFGGWRFPNLGGVSSRPLHCFLLGPPNNLFKKLEDIVECVEGLKSFKEKHHLKMTEGNSFLLLFENIFGNILQKINF